MPDKLFTAYNLSHFFQKYQLLAATEDEEEMDWSKYHVVGNCQDLEKRYYRLTTVCGVPLVFSTLKSSVNTNMN